MKASGYSYNSTANRQLDSEGQSLPIQLSVMNCPCCQLGSEGALMLLDQAELLKDCTGIVKG